MVVVQFTVKVPDVDHFTKAYERFLPMMEERGGRSAGLYQSEADPSEVTSLDEWASHDAMHAASEEIDKQFNEEAGSGDLDWETAVWHQAYGGTLEGAASDRVLVQFRVAVPDVDRFLRAVETWRGKFEADGGRNPVLFTNESSPSEIGWFADWPSHDAMMESSERYGESFQADAGTEGLDWETRIWHRLA